ncbi:DUF4384 domain-containing protein [Deinococcus sonorensis]|uniref:DUF4384 domain-containing protein n=2 Tax=Deinococcus sonorensis TaxID=309891 RepID=A0AAU7UDF0_9DEIO
MRSTLLLGTLALGLSACTVSVQSNLGVAGSTDSGLISALNPDRGEGSSYYVGEAVRFYLTTRTSGYVTLLSLDPNGNSNVLIRGASVGAGTTVFPRPQDGAVFNVAPPRGVQRVRAIFTRVRPSADLYLSGQYSSGSWNATIQQRLGGYAVADRDVRETFFYIR